MFFCQLFLEIPYIESLVQNYCNFLYKMRYNVVTIVLHQALDIKIGVNLLKLDYNEC